MVQFAYCWASGLIEFGAGVPDGALLIAGGPQPLLREVIEPIARHAYDGRSLLIPGVPEAADEEAAVRAVEHFVERVTRCIATGRAR